VTAGALGAPRLRREDERFVTGRGRYVPNIPVEGVLHCAFVRGTAAHGELPSSVDLSAVRGSPGVIAAFGAHDLDLPDIPGRTGEGHDAPLMTRPPLARGRVRYAGEAVAVVVAESLYQAADAVELADLDVDPLPVIADPAAALRDDVLLFPAAGTNVVSRFVTPDGAAEPSLDRWPVQATIEVENQRLAPVPVEPLGIVAVPGEDGRLAVWAGHQAPHRLRRQLAGMLGVDEERLRVVVPDVGGGFGHKGMFYPEYVVVAATALALGRPVRWVETRSEQFLGGTHGRGQTHRITLAGDGDGRIRAARIEILADLGAYPHNGSHLSTFTSYMAVGPYAIHDVWIEATMVVTNRAPVGSYRGAGRPEATYALERAVEAFARAAGLDSVEVRRRNLVAADRMPYRTPTGALYDSGDYRRALDRVLELVDVDAVRADQARRLQEGRNPVGLGVAAFVERAGGAKDSVEYARVELNGEGRVVGRLGTAAAGQGHETVWTQILADAFGLDDSRIVIVTADTDAVADGVGTFASRSAQIGGSALHRVAVEVREQCRSLAADLLEAAASDLLVQDGRVCLAGDPRGGVDLAGLAAAAGERGLALAAEESYSPHAQTFPYGATAAVVEVDRETGRVDLRRLASVDDVGTVLNPLIVEGQVHGSLAQGIAQALYEEVRYDDEGQLLTSTLADYLTPTAPDLPELETARLQTPAPSNPLGAKGAGESGCLSAPPAVVNAVLAALAPYGVTDLQMPLTPERVWRALTAAGPKEASQ
jgi:aerobic carbon-monoxide dehydrogenase large subunit